MYMYMQSLCVLFFFLQGFAEAMTALLLLVDKRQKV